MTDKIADLAGPGIGDYAELEKILPSDYTALLDPKETQKAIFTIKNYIESQLAQELNLMRVECPLIVDAESGINDYLDRDGSRTPIQFHISNDNDKNPIDAQIVQAATKWKRMALKQFGMQVGEGLYTDMRAVRKDYFLDHDHSAYVDQCDWKLVITEEQRSLQYLKYIVEKIWKIIKGPETHVQKLFPQLKTAKYPNLPDKLTFLHAEDILVWNPVTKRRHELTSMGIRVNAKTLRMQLELAGQLEFLKYPYHQAILKNEVPLSIGGGIGQFRTYMLLLRKAHLGECSVTVWPRILKAMCKKRNIHVLE
jgi:aspartate--ammonia ligase